MTRTTLRLTHITGLTVEVSRLRGWAQTAGIFGTRRLEPTYAVTMTLDGTVIESGEKHGRSFLRDTLRESGWTVARA